MIVEPYGPIYLASYSGSVLPINLLKLRSELFIVTPIENILSRYEVIKDTNKRKVRISILVAEIYVSCGHKKTQS